MNLKKINKVVKKKIINSFFEKIMELTFIIKSKKYKSKKSNKLIIIINPPKSEFCFYEVFFRLEDHKYLITSKFLKIENINKFKNTKYDKKKLLIIF